MNLYQSLIHAASFYVGVTEQKGKPNGGPNIEEWQRFVDGKAAAEPWCCAFVEAMIGKAASDASIPHPLKKTEHVLTLWNSVPAARRHEVPKPGFLMVWQHEGTTNGHIGIVEDVAGTVTPPPFVITIEGNTGLDNNEVTREGDGVYRKMRSLWPRPGSKMKLLGFVDTWGKYS